MKIKNVESFWNSNPCEACRGQDRYIRQPKIPLYANFKAYEGKKVLEIGCGAGMDGLQFAKAGAFYTGVDLTDEAIRLTRERLNAAGQSGILKKINAEELPFPDESFSHVYSFGGYPSFAEP
ncbi:MAG: class I SAM-dependent methyltransferase [Candidatus Omnitrophota bacterium]